MATCHESCLPSCSSPPSSHPRPCDIVSLGRSEEWHHHYPKFGKQCAPWTSLVRWCPAKECCHFLGQSICSHQMNLGFQFHTCECASVNVYSPWNCALWVHIYIYIYIYYTHHAKAALLWTSGSPGKLAKWVHLSVVQKNCASQVAFGKRLKLSKNLLKLKGLKLKHLKL
jgi:hypothetical protein